MVRMPTERQVPVRRPCVDLQTNMSFPRRHVFFEPSQPGPRARRYSESYALHVPGFVPQVIRERYWYVQ